MKCDDTTGSLAHQVVMKYMNTNKLHRAILERRLNATGVYRSQHQILMCIARNPDMSQKEIADRNFVSTATIAVSLKKLEKGGYIAREMNADDNRFNQIRITEKGRKIVQHSFEYFKSTEEAMLAGFSDEELVQFCGFLDRMKDNLNHLQPKDRQEE